MNGVTETKEAILAVVTLIKFGIAQAKDGLDFKDVGVLVEKLIKDEAFRAIFINAFSGIQNIPAELKDLDFQEGVELVSAVIAELKTPV